MGEVVLANSKAVVAGFQILSSGVELALGGVVFIATLGKGVLIAALGESMTEKCLSQSHSRASRSVICYECKKPGHMNRECSK